MADPLASSEHDIKSVEHYYELRDWGGILHPLSIRVLFYLWNDIRSICIVGVFLKKTPTTPMAQKVRARKRIRMLLAGDFGDPAKQLRKTHL